jgi:hypothetical protein
VCVRNRRKPNATHPCLDEIVTSLVHIGDWDDTSEGILFERAVPGTVKGDESATYPQCQPNSQSPEVNVGDVIERRLRSTHRMTLQEPRLKAKAIG